MICTFWCKRLHIKGTKHSPRESTVGYLYSWEVKNLLALTLTVLMYCKSIWACMLLFFFTYLILFLLCFVLLSYFSIPNGNWSDCNHSNALNSFQEPLGHVQLQKRVGYAPYLGFFFFRLSFAEVNLILSWSWILSICIMPLCSGYINSEQTRSI